MNVRKQGLRIYVLRDSHGDALYVGISGNVGARLSQHLLKPWGDQVATVELLDVADETDPYAAEQQVIGSEKPRYNQEAPRRKRQDGDCYFFRFCGSAASTSRRLNYRPKKWKTVGVCEEHRLPSYSALRYREPAA
jgi:hypothetical protein